MPLLRKKPKAPKSFIQPFTIAISGAADTGHCAPDAYEKTLELGRLIAKRGIVLVTGATNGAPQWAAKAAKEAGGMVIGFSPASSRQHHVKSYRLPTDYHDVIVYTGFDYAGRNILLARSADAVITICGRIGSLNEYTAAFEEQVVQGVMTGTGGIADMIEGILDNSHRGRGRTVFASDPKELLDKVVSLIEEEAADIEHAQENRSLSHGA
jgi:hypothetical protein